MQRNRRSRYLKNLRMLQRKESRDRADAATVRISSSCCNCLPHRHCPYLYGSGKPGKYGTKLGIPLKAETNGSAGADNVLTAEEIKNAECIIIAADKSVRDGPF